MVLLKVVSKNGKKWEDTKIVVDNSLPKDIKNQFYDGSRKWPEFFPSFLFVVEIKDDVVFIESVINVLKGLSIDNDLQDEDYQEKLYIKLSKNYPDLTKDHYLNAIFYVLSDPEDRSDIIEAILEQKLVTEVIEDEEEEEENLEPIVNLLRFKISFGKIYADPVNLQEIYDSLTLNENLIIAKTFYGNSPEYLSSGLSIREQKAVDNFVYSEHFTDRKEKILPLGVINFLMYMNNSVITGRISDLGIVGLKIEPKMMSFSNYNFNSLKNNLKLLYGYLDTDFKTFEIKVVYPTGFGYYPKKIIANIEGTQVKNEKVEFILEEKRVWYSSANNMINFTVKNINSELDITKTLEMINRRVEWYGNNLLKIKSIKKMDEDKMILFLEEPHLFTKQNEYVKVLSGYYKISEFTSSSITINTIDTLNDAKTIIFSGPRKKQSLKLLRKLGLNVNSKECEKSRRPVLLSKDDLSIGENILELNGRKFKCFSPYNYHGIINKTNCCYKTKQLLESTSVTAVKRKPLKLFDKLKKGSTKILEGTFIDYLDSKFTLKTPEDLPKDRTITSCLILLYGIDVINESLNNLTEELYAEYFKNGMDLITWKNTETKSIDDIILAVSVYKNVNILLFLDNAIDGLYVKCRTFLGFNKYAVIYKSTQKIDSYYLLNKGELLEFKETEIQDLVDISRNACKSGFSESVYTFKSIVKAQVFDYQNLVVFVELLNGGYIPVIPSTIDASIDSYSITSEKFVLLKPEAQYTSLLRVSTEFPQLTPIGLTKILDEDIVTGIKLKNGGFSPVSHSKWDTVLIPDVSDLFYIQTYGSEKDEFVDEELAFSNNLKEFYKIADIELLNKNVENYDYVEVINMVKALNVSEDETSRLAWYLINNI